MKKFTIIAVALCVGFMLAVPAMALEIENDGSIRVRGYSDKGYSLDDTLQSTNSYYDQRLRINTKFIVSDQLMIRTRVDILDAAVVGDIVENTDEANVDWERAWMVVKTPVGAFQAGWMSGGAWGTSFWDTGNDQFRVRFDTQFGAIKTGIITRKALEGDIGNEFSSGDLNVYYGYVLYPSEAITAGLLYGYVDMKHASNVGATRYTALRHAFLPFFKTKVGPVALQGEAVYWTGDGADYSDPALVDTDIDTLAFNLEGSMNFGGLTAQLGYAFASGQERGANPDVTGTHVGDDWEKLYILTGSTGPTPGGIGGVGNATPTGGNLDGLELIYGGVTFNATEAVRLSALFGTASADETDAGQDDDLGFELDLKLKWSFYDGALTYSAVAAYLAAGDYWETGVGAANFEDSCYALYHNITLSF